MNCVLGQRSHQVVKLFSSPHKQIDIDHWTKVPPKPNIDSVVLDRLPGCAKRFLSLNLTLPFLTAMLSLKECARRERERECVHV